MPSFDILPPSGIDRADGSHGVGTPTPNEGLITSRPFFFEEDAGSPEIERGEQGTITHNFTCDINTGLVMIQGLSRGRVLTDSFGNLTKVLTTRLTRARGDVYRLSVTCESLSFDSPPERFRVRTIEQNFPLEKHPKYYRLVTYNTDPIFGLPIDPAPKSYGSEIVYYIHLAVDAPLATGRVQGLQFILDTTHIPDADITSLALDLYRKFLKQEETWYLPGLEVTWSRYFFLPPLLDPGGYIQDPVTEGGLPPFFWSDTGQFGGHNILEDLAADVNPLIYQDGIDWLKKADDLNYERTWFELVHTWIGAPIGLWDRGIYPNP